MPLASRPNSALKSKQDINPSIDRNTEATAQDFADYNAILEDHANLIDDLSKAYAAATFYGIRGSLALFQAEFADAVEGYGVIDPGNGNPQIIAEVTNGVWTATANVAPIQRFNTKLDRPQPGIEDVIYVVKDEKILSLWYDGSYKDFGKDGYNGKSTYQIALDFGFVGTETEWLLSMKGTSAYQTALDNGFSGTEAAWLISLEGIAGKSAYEVAVAGGFAGTEAAWLISIEGLDGEPGPIGKSNYQLWLDAGNVGTFQDYKNTLKGDPGPAGEVSAAQLANAKQEAIDAAKVYTDSVIAASGVWQNIYPTITQLLAGQANQTTSKPQFVLDASIDTTVNAANTWATYILKDNATKTGALTDYRKLSEQESLDVVASGVGADLTGELKFDSYPNTRNDGQLAVNKILSTDASGNLKMYSTAIAPAPFLNEVIPDSYLPSTTGMFKLKGSFFTENMTVTTTGGTVNYITFNNDNDVDVNITTGATEGAFSVTIDNGISKTFTGVLLIILGNVVKPIAADWYDITGIPEINTGEFKITTANVKATGKVFSIPTGQDFRLYVTPVKSPLGTTKISAGLTMVDLYDTLNVRQFSISIYCNGIDLSTNKYEVGDSTTTNRDLGVLLNGLDLSNPKYVFFERIGTQIKMYVESNPTPIVSSVVADFDMYVKIDVQWWDLIDIKYVELI